MAADTDRLADRFYSPPPPWRNKGATIVGEDGRGWGDIGDVGGVGRE
jgi:hypothetical protein